MHEAPRRVSIFGATGSIGCATLRVIDHLGGRGAFEIVAVTGNRNVGLLARRAVESGAEIAVTADPALYRELREALAGTGIAAAAGISGLTEAAERDAGLVMAAIAGMAGLTPTLAAVRRGADIALANKECLVSAGALFQREMERGGGTLLPVDSEHNAIHQLLERGRRDGAERVILTASGGPFRKFAIEAMAAATPEMAAAHPNWSMGLGISIDSASMFNKALEMIEAMHLFALRPEQIEVVVHPQSIVHSMVGYRDGSVMAQLGAPDMRTAIGYALCHPRRPSLPVERLDFARLARLDFEPPDERRFPALALARRCMRAGGLSGAILNAAREVALEAFIDGRIGFLDMAGVVERVMDRLGDGGEAASIGAVYAADEAARAFAGECVHARAARDRAS